MFTDTVFESTSVCYAKENACNQATWTGVIAMRGRKWLPIFVRRANAGVAGIRYLIRGLIVGVVMAAVPVPGYSAIVTVTVGGTVSFGLDQAGLFGVAGADLTGDPFNAVYTFDTGMPGALTISSPTEVAVYGGSSYPAPTPSLGATITIGGQSQHINGTFVGSTQALITGGQSRQNQVAWDSSGSGGSSTSVELLTDVYAGLGVMPLAVDQSFSTGSLASPSYGFFSYFVGGVQSTSLSFAPTSITTAVASVPEPANWAMLLSGVSLVGVIARRRKQART